MQVLFNFGNMPKRKIDKIFDPSDGCIVCGTSEKVNYTRKKNELANCLTQFLAEALLKTSEHEKDMVKSGKDGLKFPPEQKVKSLSGTSRKSLHVNVSAAALVLESWKKNGLTLAASRYIRCYHAPLQTFLETHHGLHLAPEPACLSEEFEMQVDAYHDDSEHVTNSSNECSSAFEQAAALDSGAAADLDQVDNSDDGIQVTRNDCIEIEQEGEDDFDEVEEASSESDDDFDHERGGTSVTLNSEAAPRVTHRQAFERIKATLMLSDSVMNKILSIWKKLKPVEDWDKFTTDARLLARPGKMYMAELPIRKVICGLSVKDGIPYHDAQKKEEMLQRFATTGTALDVTEKTIFGDVVDFSIQDCLLLRSPGMTNSRSYFELLTCLNAANPLLLSSKLLQLVDKKAYHNECLHGAAEGRSKMNCFFLQAFTDGLQVAKSSTKPQGIPILCALHRVCPYEPVSKSVDWERGMRIPYRFSDPFTVVLYHGSKKPELFDFTKKFFQELHFLHPKKEMLPGENRELVVEFFLQIADTPMKAHVLGMHVLYIAFQLMTVLDCCMYFPNVCMFCRLLFN
jgi:hypothetical protein